MPASDGLEAREIDVHPTLAVQIDGRSGTAPADISSAMGEAFDALQSFVAERELTVIGPPRAIYRTWGPEGTSFTVAFPVQRGASADPEDRVYLGELAGGQTYRFTHRGPYEGLMGTYEAITAWLRDRGLFRTDADWSRYTPMWEEYVNEPGRTPPEELVTYIYLPRNESGAS